MEVEVEVEVGVVVVEEVGVVDRKMKNSLLMIDGTT